jgi:hypothetical protein
MYPLHKPPDLFTPSIEQMGSLEVQVLIPGKSELVTLDVSHESYVFEGFRGLSAGGWIVISEATGEDISVE